MANLLDNNFAVRAVVRSLPKAAPLQRVFKSYVDAGKLTFVVVPDITAPSAFTSALSGIDGAIHCASPMVPSDPNANPQDVIGPAVEGTLRILQDAAKVDTIKRIVVTSSVVALLEPKEVKYAYTEVDWFDTAPKIVQQQGKKAPGGLKYVASKVLAEHAAWDWVERTTPHSNLSQCFLPMCGVNLFWPIQLTLGLRHLTTASYQQFRERRMTHWTL